VGKPEEKKPLETLEHIGDNNNKIKKIFKK
jgi:hypothetical protein